MNILVTGIGGDIGDSIGRILRGSGVAGRLIGCDIHDRHLGKFVFNECYLLPRADAPDYLDRLVGLARASGVDLIIPASEPEQRSLKSQEVLREIDGIPLIIANRESLDVGFDKLRTAQFLEANGLPFPWTRRVDTEDPRELPCIIKSRFGAGSKQVGRVERSDMVAAYRVISPDYIWQEQVGTVDEEYTCGVFGSRACETRVIAFRRRLNGGITASGEAVVDREIDRLCRAIAGALMLEGSINVQLRMTERGPVVFEINPRFSSTVIFRHRLGFCDVLWSISNRMEGRVAPYDGSGTVGARIFRKFEEVILEN